MQLTSRLHQRGVSILELMIGIAIGLIVVASSLIIYVNGARSSTESIRANRFNQDMREVVDIMVNDIRRAGYTANNSTGTANPFTENAATVITIGGTGNSCILYAYDAVYEGGAAGVIDAGVDVFGFRLNGTTLQMLNPASGIGSTAVATCSDANAWVDLTDPNQIQIQSLAFSTAGSRCLSYAAATYNPSNSATYAEWTIAASQTVNACDATATSQLVTAPATFPQPSTNTFIESRQINLSMTGVHASEATFTRTASETVVVRNNRAWN